MNVLYDGEKFVTQTAGGISAYFSRLIANLPNDITPIVAIRETSSLYLPDHPRIRFVKPKRLSSKLLTTLVEQATFGYQLRARKYDLIHPTYYETIMVNDISAFSGPLVLTVHDMIHELFRSRIDPLGRHIAIKRRAIERADAIICVSQNTRRDLIDIYNVDEKKISVVYEAPAIDRVPQPSGTLRAPVDYFLYVGSRDAAYKNFFIAVDAIAALASKFPKLKLLVVGNPWEPSEINYIRNKDVADKITHLGHVSQEQLALLYRDSVALLYPSLYEGFGIPPLEAMACGSVVIACAVASLPEVVGTAGILVDPKSPADFIDAMRQLLTDPGEREKLVRLGSQRVKEFNWARTAAETAAIYRRLSAGLR